MVKSYLKYLKNRVNAHGIHSPFVFNFYNEIIKKKKLGQLNQIETLRKKLIKNHETLTVNDLGAGSRKGSNSERTISEITRNAGISEKQGALIARIIDYYKIENVLELGTSVGLAAAYMAMANEKVRLHTIEGCANTAAIAKNNILDLGLDNVSVEVGEFSDVLQQEKFKNQVYDLIYIDGNHQYQPTLNYFDFAVNHTHDSSFIILDDVHWSDEMEKAWEEIQLSKAVNVTMDLFGCGIVCKRKGQRKEHFVLKF